MSPESFCYWLQGYFELSKEDQLTKEQVKIIKNHLKLVFFHSIDPETYGERSEEAQTVHDGEEFYRLNPHLDPNKDWGNEPRPKC